MLAKSILAPILSDELLTRILGDAEARMLVEWLSDEAERRAGDLANDELATREVIRLRRWGRGIAKFIQLWCYHHAHGPAIQLAASEGFSWPLPTDRIEPCELMEHILGWQDQPAICRPRCGQA